MAQRLTGMHTKGCREFGEFAYQVRDYLLDEVDELHPPDILPTEEVEIDGVAFESADVGELTTLIQCKEEYNESILSDIRNDRWDGTRLGFDALLLMAAKAGLDRDAVRRAVAAPLSVRVCPRCGGTITDRGIGARACYRCEWHEDVRQKARAVAYVDESVLKTEALPVREDLPSHVLVLDATADERIHRGYFGRKPGIVGDVEYEMDLDVTQFLDGQYHRSTITDGAYKRIQPVIEQRCQEHETVLIAGHRKARPFFDLPENAEFIHYMGATKALNKDDCDHVIVIGANHLPPDAARRHADLLSIDTDMDAGGVEQSSRREAPNDPEMRTYVFEDEIGMGRQGPTKTYSGLTGVVFEQRREKEIEQAVHRVRPLLASKSADLVTNVRTELPISRFAQLNEFEPDPCEQVLGHFDDEFTIEMVTIEFDVSESTARRWLKELRERDEIAEIDGLQSVKTYWYA